MSDNWDPSGDDWNNPPNTASNEGATAGQHAFHGGNDDAAEFNNSFEDTNATNGNGGGENGGCHNCGQDGHFARECPEPRKAGACFNCGEEGHSKAECSKPRVFTGTCNICSEQGHPAARCPSKPKSCSRCKEEGDHDTKDCKNNFYIDLNDVADLSEGAAWAKVVESSLDNDLDDFKDAIRVLQKAAPEITYPAIEQRLRDEKLAFYLIGLKKDVGEGYTLVDLQGVPEKTFCIAINKSPDCKRPNMVDKWPGSAEENLVRLADAGIPMERGLQYCRNCASFGHVTRDCDHEKTTPDAVKIICALCSEEGHRVRDCKEPRKKARAPMACRICEGEHMAKDCDQKQVMKCRNCDQEGHKAADCTEPRVLKCLNCDETGHSRKECPKPMDWSKAKCRHCGEMGHLSASRCAPGAAKKEDDNDAVAVENANGNAHGDTGAAGNGDWDNGNANPNVASATEDWDAPVMATPAAASSLW